MQSSEQKEAPPATIAREEVEEKAPPSSARCGGLSGPAVGREGEPPARANTRRSSVAKAAENFIRGSSPPPPPLKSNNEKRNVIFWLQ
ncbi:Hypothetical predicted protein [Podarcis lilfordi]|uniref:Uncharacterized protein n=1 Tax=Podarcis lilfordi TaxID=74358 RepID=A0AA35P256_9SAUR|nr:Hypothetical predicted protein [Podarcis lilfordi]